MQKKQSEELILIKGLNKKMSKLGTMSRGINEETLGVGKHVKKPRMETNTIKPEVRSMIMRH